MLFVLMLLAACSEDADTMDRQEEPKGGLVQLSSVTRTSTLDPDGNNYDIKIYVMSRVLSILLATLVLQPVLPVGRTRVSVSRNVSNSICMAICLVRTGVA